MKEKKQQQQEEQQERSIEKGEKGFEHLVGIVD
jgi:hypothetical protein